jgi:hypothetical protein
MFERSAGTHFGLVPAPGETHAKTSSTMAPTPSTSSNDSSPVALPFSSGIAQPSGRQRAALR